MPLVLAHRGVAVPGPQGTRENTVDAFAAARRLGADGVELDVRRSADGALVVHHDAEIPGLGKIANLPASQLPPWVPGLADAFAACRGMVVDIEVKHDPADGPERTVAVALGDELQAAAPTWPGGVAAILVSSFDARSLDVVAERAPAVPTGFLVGWADDPMAGLDHAQRHRCAAVHPFVAGVDAALVAEARRRGLAVNAWTVNADADLAAMVSLGVDAVITDRVPAALAAMGRWNGGDGAGSSTIGP